MRPIIFLKPNHHYDSYNDFWALVRCSGFEVQSIHDADFDADVTYIITPWNGEVDQVLPRSMGKRARKIFWLLERPDAPGRPPVPAVCDQALALVDEMWVGDRWYATQDPRLKYVFMGSHPAMGAPQDNKLYDFAHISYAYGRRENIYAQLRGQGFSEMSRQVQASSPNTLRRVELGATRCMLNLQQYTTAQIVAPIRFAVAAANKMALLSEQLWDPWPLIQGVHFLAADFAADMHLMRDATIQARFGEQIYQLCCVERPFRKCVEEAVAQ